MPRFRVNGLTLHYEVRRAGHPVVLLHGFTSSGDSWERHGWSDLLAGAGLRPIALDARSHGQSDRVVEAAACATEILAADVVALLDELAIARASLFGFSMGGGIALQVAMRWPERVSRVAVAGVGDAAIDELHDPAEIAELASAFGGGPAGTNAMRLQRNAELAGNDPNALLPYLLQAGWPGGLRKLAPVEAPTLVVLADGDEYMADAGELVARLAPTEVVRIHGKSHYEVLRDERAKHEVVTFLSLDAASHAA